MRRLSSFFIGCSGAVVALATFLVGVEISAISAASPSLSSTTPIVNRTLKSDRLPLVLNKSRNAVNGPAETQTPPAPAPKPKLLDGCEPMVSAIGRSPLAQVAGSCVS